MSTEVSHQAEAWTKDVHVEAVGGQLAVGADHPGKVRIINESDRKLAFKLHTTRSEDVQPNIGVGLMPANGSRTEFEVPFTPGPNTRPFSENDHITIIMTEAPEGAKSASQFWKTHKPELLQRFKLPLKPWPPTTSAAYAPSQPTSPAETAQQPTGTAQQPTETAQQPTGTAAPWPPTGTAAPWPPTGAGTIPWPPTGAGTVPWPPTGTVAIIWSPTGTGTVPLPPTGTAPLPPTKSAVSSAASTTTTTTKAETEEEESESESESESEAE